MRLIAFLQLYNELETGNLKRCLSNCQQWADDIFIYDDCSTDGSQEVYLEYTSKDNIILGQNREFNRELFHKQELLQLALKTKPDWIGWIDGDTVLSKSLTSDCKSHLRVMQKQGYDGLRLHNMNLWRHPAFYRLDNSFDDLWHVVFWKNSGRLNYKPSDGLHQQQFPEGMKNIGSFSDDLHRLLHYGFAKERLIARKYLIYKSYGQTGWDLERLIDEQSSFNLQKVPKYLYPDSEIPLDYDEIQTPIPITYEKYRKYDSWEQYLIDEKGTG